MLVAWLRDRDIKDPRKLPNYELMSSRIIDAVAACKLRNVPIRPNGEVAIASNGTLSGEFEWKRLDKAADLGPQTTVLEALSAMHSLLKGKDEEEFANVLNEIIVALNSGQYPQLQEMPCYELPHDKIDSAIATFRETHGEHGRQTYSAAPRAEFTL